MEEMSASEARAEWARVLRLVRGGQQVTVTQHGEPAAVVVDIAMWQRVQVALEDGADIGAGHAAMQRIESGEKPVPWEELAPHVADLVAPAVLAQVRAELGLTADLPNGGDAGA